MKHFKKTILSISVLAAFSGITEAKTLPFIDSSHIIHQTITTKHKKLVLSHFVTDHVIDLSFNDLKDDDIPALITFLNQHPDINNVDLEGNDDLTAKGLVPLASVKSITKLNLNRIDNECKDNVCKGGLTGKDMDAFANNTSLISLSLGLHNVGDEGATKLAKNTHLKELNLFVNNITDVGGIQLAANQTLETLDLTDNDVGNETAIALAANPSLKEVILGQTNVDDKGGVALGNQSHAKTLGLYFNSIGDATAIALANNPYLTKLWVDETNISVVGAKAFAQNQIIRTLDLSGDFFGSDRPNDIRDEGAIALAQNNSLQTLYLDNQEITTAGAVALADNDEIGRLTLAGNYGIKDKGVIALARKQFITLSVAACSVTDKGAIALAKYPPQHLIADFNDISDAGAAALSKAYISTLDLSYNEIHDEGGLAFAYSGNTKLSYLDISMNRMTTFANEIINKHNGWLAGGENPYPPQHPLVHGQFYILQNTKPLKANHVFCYRTQNKVACTNKENIVHAS